MALTGDKVTAVATTSDRQTIQGDTASTLYTSTLTGGIACGLAFVAPASGAVLVLNKVYGYNGASGTSFNFCSYEIRTGGTIGSGTVFQAAADSTALVVSQVNSQSTHEHVTGLTPGATYNIRQMFRVDGNTGRFINKQLTIHPCI
jgi:hypothetical protein